MNGLVLPLLLSLLALAVFVLALGMAVNAVRARLRPRPARRIVVIGVGGAGGNVVDRMVRAKSAGAELWACNTDTQARRRCVASHKLQIGRKITGGLGAGGDPSVGQRAAEDDARVIAQALAGADVVFVAAGLGGGTGSGAAPVVARIAREKGALAIGVVTRPFAFEGAARAAVADGAVEALHGSVDALITIPNESVRRVLLENVSIVDTFGVVDQVLVGGVQALIDLIRVPGFINLDFADVRAVLRDAGPAVIGVGRARGDERARDAAHEAISNPLLEVGVGGARAVLLNVSGPPELSLGEVSRAAEEVRAAVDPKANLIFGANLDERLGDEVQVTVIATGFGGSAPEARAAAERPATGERSGTAERPAAGERSGTAERPAARGARDAAGSAPADVQVPGFPVGDGPAAAPRSASR
ncbi:MAG: cell division protein FtsZ [Candidatus Limnocylindrales bacterium]